ncbi:MAG: glycosyltransferase family 39 protein [Archangium sp.]|nr:glycosyltransferase family 39 protein [Archangium sp.]
MSPTVHRLKAFFTSFPFLLFAFTRLAYVGMSWMGLNAVNTLFYNDYDRHRVLQPYTWIDGLCRWDCGWFHNLVVNGYLNVEYAKVFPLLAVIGGGVEKLTGINHLVVFIIVANICSLAAYVVIYRLFTEIENEEAARFALLLLTAFPFAYYSAAGYPESMMMLATAYSIDLARRGKHIGAGFALTLGFAARHLTLAGGAGILAAQIRQRGLNPKKFLLNPAVLGLLLPWLFLAGFSFYLSWKVGDPLAWWNSRKIGWNDWVWYSFRQTLMYVPYWDRPEYFYYILFSIPVVGGAVGLLIALKNKRWEYVEISAYGLALLFVVMSSGAAGMGRYLASIWPCFLPLGVWLAKRPMLQGPVLGFFWLFQGLWFFLFSHQWRVL